MSVHRFSMQVGNCEKKENERKRQGERKRTDRQGEKRNVVRVCLRLLNRCKRQSELQQKIKYSQFVVS